MGLFMYAFYNLKEIAMAMDIYFYAVNRHKTKKIYRSANHITYDKLSVNVSLF